VPMAFDAASLLLGPGGSFLLVVARVSGLAWLAPGWGTTGLGWRLRLALIVLLSLVLMPTLGTSVTAPSSWAMLAQTCLTEALIGAALGWTAALVISAARQAGEVVGAQAGLSPAALFDPESGGEMTPLGHLYGLIALGTFLALDGPLALVGALIESYRTVPAAGLPLTAESAAWAFGQVGQALGLALRIAAPAAVALALAGVAIALISRAAPTLQFMALALPLRTAVGVFLVWIGLVTLVAALASAWANLPVTMFARV